MRDSLIIGLVGKNGSGKSTFPRVLRAVGGVGMCKVQACTSGELLKETLKPWDIEPTRSNLQEVAICMERSFGKGALAHAMENQLIQSNAEIVIFDGARWPSQIEVIRSFQKNCLVYINVDAKIRFERLKARDEKPGEANLTWKSFLKEGRARTETRIPVIAKSADFTIYNNGSLGEYQDQVADLYEKYIKQYL